MSTIPGTPVTVENYLQQPLVIGEPDVSGPMSVYPVFGAPSNLSYISMTPGPTARASRSRNCRAAPRSGT